MKIKVLIISFLIINQINCVNWELARIGGNTLLNNLNRLQFGERDTDSSQLAYNLMQSLEFTNICIYNFNQNNLIDLRCKFNDENRNNLMITTAQSMITKYPALNPEQIKSNIEYAIKQIQNAFA